MPNWTHKIELLKAISAANEAHDLTRVEEPCPAEVLESFAAEVSKAPPLARFAGKLRKCKTIAEVNRTLERVFDAADSSRVWCGMPSFD
jgi:hypothetical protein